MTTKKANAAKTVYATCTERDAWGAASLYTTEWADGVYRAETVKPGKLALWTRMGFRVVILTAADLAVSE